ncbi:retrovirus-related pol polyprotein from transposon TNT 1-94, partial [Tanacetum coccineum]
RVSSTNASESKSGSNTKNDRIPQSSCRSMENKVEAHHRKFKSSTNKKNLVSDCNANVKNVALKTMPPSSSDEMSTIVVPPGHILTTTVIPVDVPCLKLNLEVAFRKHTCFVRNLEGVDLLLGSRGSNLYTISMADMMMSSLICLLSKASKTKSWLWHCRLSHLNFGTINKLAKQGLVNGLPTLKYINDHLCSACQMGRSKKESYPHKPEPSTNEKLQMLHMDLYRPMRVESINKKRYILVIVDDYSRFTWTNSTEFSQSDTTNYMEVEAAEFDSDTFTNPFSPLDTSLGESSSRIVDTSNMNTFQQPPIYTKRWTKGHSLVTIIDDPSKPVSTRRQLSTDAL